MAERSRRTFSRLQTITCIAFTVFIARHAVLAEQGNDIAQSDIDDHDQGPGHRSPHVSWERQNDITDVGVHDYDEAPGHRSLNNAFDQNERQRNDLAPTVDEQRRDFAKLLRGDHLQCDDAGDDEGNKRNDRPPNVVFILADDYGFNDVGYHGKDHGSVIQTPNLDKLAGEGVKLENYYVQPICSPTRSQLLSGRYQIHTGLQHGVIRPPQANSLPLDEVTLPQKLKESGYSTHMVGKWHVGFYKDACLPTERGFDSYFGYLIGAEDYYSHMRSYNVPSLGLVMNGYDLHGNKTPVEQYKGQYSTHLFTQKAIDAIHSHDTSKPLFLYLAYQSVHGPLEVPAKYEEPYAHIDEASRRKYAGMVSCMDEGIGNLTAALQKAGIYNDTIIIFSTDNGGPIDVGANNWPLRGSKGTLWEGGVHGVGFVHSPLLPDVVKGTVNRELIHVSDWLPTLVAGVAGGSLNGTKPLDGFNVWESIRGNDPSPRKELLHNIDPLDVALPGMTSSLDLDADDEWTPAMTQYHFKDFNTSMRAALRVGDWKIQTGSASQNTNCWKPAPETGRSAIFPIQKPDQRVWLFNITADPYEEKDLSDTYPDVVEQLLHRLDQYYQDSVPVRYPEPDENADPALHGGFWGPWE